MEIRISKSENDDKDETESLKSMNEEITKGTFSSLEGEKHKNVLVLNSKFSNNTENYFQESFVPYVNSLDRRLPKHIISLDEKYLRYCLKLVYANATRTISYNSVPTMSTSFDGVNSLNFNTKYAYSSSEFVDCFPLEDGIIEHENMGTIRRSEAGVNLMKHPSFRQSVSSENEIVNATKSAVDTISTSSLLGISLLPKPGKKMSFFESDRFKQETEYKRHISSSSTSIVSDSLSFKFLGNFNRGMLRCTLQDGLPCYVFTLDDGNKVLLANMITPQLSNNSCFDYLYMFYSNDGCLVGKMRVSTSFKLCRNYREVKETNFVLFGIDESDTREVQNSPSHNVKKSKGLSERISEVLKTSHTSRARAAKKHGSTNETPLVDLSTDFLSNLELASVIVKDHVCGIHQEPEGGGWGMMFLKKKELKSENSSINTSLSACDYFVENNGVCSMSTDIIIPYGFHGGPRNGIGGPTSLVERWRSGGQCDCGGWDIGCPIMVLNTEQKKEANLSQIDIRSWGKRDSSPVMKIVNNRDGLYVIRFESNLSALQTFAIAVSIIHSQTVK